MLNDAKLSGGKRLPGETGNCGPKIDDKTSIKSVNQFTLEAMLEAATITTVFVTLISVGLNVKFMNSLRREAPHLYHALMGKRAGQYFWRARPILPFVSLILFRMYRRELAEYPVSRAWASWLSLVHFVMAGALVVMVVAILGGGHGF